MTSKLLPWTFRKFFRESRVGMSHRLYPRLLRRWSALVSPNCLGSKSARQALSVGGEGGRGAEKARLSVKSPV